MRARSRNLVLAAAAWLLGGCATFSAIDEVPPAFRERLAKHDEWLTISSFDNRRSQFPPTDLLAIKRWRVTEKRSGEAREMRELMTSSFLGVVERVRHGDHAASELSLTGPIAFEELLPYRDGVDVYAAEGERDTYEFQEIDKDRFQVVVNGGRGRIAFMPAPTAAAGGANAKGRLANGMWYAPFGPESEIFAYLLKLMEKDGDTKPLERMRDMAGAFLHHDMTRKLPVRVDPTFPQRYVPALSTALDDWNAALPSKLFSKPESSATRLDTAACLTGFQLCVRWRGGHEVPYTGMSGYTEMAFDPQTGLITGGVITLLNYDEPKADLSQPDAAKARDGKIGIDDVAQAMLQFVEMNKRRHPSPEGYLSYIFLHELGHFNGLGHDFHIDRQFVSGEAPATVMGYPPYAVAHLTKDLGVSDRVRLGVMYGRGAEKGLEPALPPYCSTLDAMVPETGGGGMGKVEQCDLFAIGDEADWYLALARFGKEGVFTTYPDTSFLPEEVRQLYRRMREERGLPPQNVLARLAYVLAGKSAEGEPGRKKVRAHLCAQTAELPAIRAQLQKFGKLTLDCAVPQS